MDDNLSLTEEVKARYRTMYAGVFYARYILGEWKVAEGLIYDMFDERRHCIPLPRITNCKVLPISVWTTVR